MLRQRCLRGGKSAIPGPIAASNREFCNEQVRDVAIFSNRPDSPVRIRSRPVVTAFPSASIALHSPGKAELASMLPGFRFLFAAIVLSMSVLVFGLGAAALLRTAHEQFVSIPSRRAPPEPVFAQRNEPPMPTLALLRFEPPVAEKAPDTIAATVVAEPDAPAASAPDPATVEPEKLAALGPEQPGPTELFEPDVPAAKNEPVAEAAAIEPPAAANDEVKVAAIAEAPPPPAPTTAPVTAPVAEAPSLEGNIAATRIATLGGPAVTIEQPTSVKTPSAKPDRSAARKRAARAKERRRIAARRAALRAQQAAAQQQANPFDPQVATRAKR
jgi:hypothetical protein